MKSFREAVAVVKSQSSEHHDAIKAFSYLSQLRYNLSQNSTKNTAASDAVLAKCDEILSAFPRLDPKQSAHDQLRLENLNLLKQIGHLTFSIIQASSLSSAKKNVPSFAAFLDICDIYGESAKEEVAKLAAHVIHSGREAEIAAALKEACSIIDSAVPSEDVKMLSNPVIILIGVIQSLRRVAEISSSFIHYLMRSSILESLSKCFDVTIPITESQFPEDSKKQLYLLKGEILILSKTILIDGFLKSLSTGNDNCEASWERFENTLRSMVSAADSVDVPPNMFHRVKTGYLTQALNLKFQLLHEMSFLLNPNELICLLDADRLSYLYDIVASVCNEVPVIRKSSSQIEATPHSKLETEHTEEVKQLIELFSNYSEDFARACLSEFGFSVDQTVNAILEGRLPPHLAQVENTSEWKKQTQEIASDKAVDASTRPSDEMLQFLSRTGRISINMARVLEEERIKKEDEVFALDAAAASVLRDRAVQSMNAVYEDEDDDTFDGYARFDIRDDAESDTNEVISTRPDSSPQTLPPKDTKSGNKSSVHPAPDNARARQFKDRHKGRFANHDRKNKAFSKRT